MLVIHFCEWKTRNAAFYSSGSIFLKPCLQVIQLLDLTKAMAALNESYIEHLPGQGHPRNIGNMSFGRWLEANFELTG